MIETSHPEIAIIRTKLAPPKVGSSPVTRGHLLQRLNCHASSKLSLVLGPAGSGKTMLLAQWRKGLSDQGHKIAWYNLGIDDDVTLVAAYIVESLRSAGLEIRSEELEIFTRSGGKTRYRFLASLVDDLALCSSEIYLIIDDFQYGMAFDSFQLLDELLEVLPDNVHIVIGSRSRPPLNLLKLKTQSQLFELDFKDLRFNTEETEQFVAAQDLGKLSDQHIHQLHQICDGWAAGLQLLLFALRKERHVDDFFRRHNNQLSLNQEGALIAYLESTVANYINAEELYFLSSISICRRFNRELCDVITGNPRAAELLEKFENEQLFLLPIDTPDPEPWYRFHRIFEGYLQRKLDARAKTDVKALYSRAAYWFANRRLHVEALQYASHADDTDLMAELIDHSARRLSGEAYFRQLLKWCNLLPRNVLRANLNISLNLAWAQISCGNLEAFKTNIETILSNPSKKSDSVRYEIQLLRAYGCVSADDTDGAIDIISPMLAAPITADAFLLSQISTLASIAFLYAGRFNEAREAARTFYRHIPSHKSQHEYLLADVVIGNTYITEGRVRDALAHMMPFKDQVVLKGKVGPDALANLIGPTCETLFEFNLIADARSLLDSYWEVISTAQLPDGILKGYRTRAKLHLFDGDHQSAFETLQLLEEIGIKRRLDRLVAWSLYDQFALSIYYNYLTSSDEILQRLSQLASRYSGISTSALAEIPLLHSLAMAECSMHEERGLEDQLKLISVAEARCHDLGRRSFALKTKFMRSLLLLENGQEKQALASALDSLQQAAKLGCRRVLANLGERALPISALLVKRPLSTEERSIVDNAISIAASVDEYGKVDSSSSLTDPLTTREQEILELLGKAFSAKSIGRSLGISPTTVKWHLKNVYGKLGATSREDALAKARRIRIID